MFSQSNSMNVCLNHVKYSIIIFKTWGDTGYLNTTLPTERTKSGLLGYGGRPSCPHFLTDTLPHTALHALFPNTRSDLLRSPFLSLGPFHTTLALFHLSNF